MVTDNEYRIIFLTECLGQYRYANIKKQISKYRASLGFNIVRNTKEIIRARIKKFFPKEEIFFINMLKEMDEWIEHKKTCLKKDAVKKRKARKNGHLDIVNLLNTKS